MSGILVEVSYAVDITGKNVQVAMTVSGNTDDEVRVAIPAWAPGAYRIVDYHKSLTDLRATDSAGAILPVQRVDDRTWSVRTNRAEVFIVNYEITGKLDKEHCFLPGPATYLYLMDHKDAACRVKFKVPEGWKVATGLDRDGDEYAARDYDTFADCSTELGKFELLEFTEGAKYQLVIHANGPVDGPRLVDMCRKIVKEHNAMFGGAPFDRYVFFYHFRGGFGGGGLEHLNSTDISLSYEAVRKDPLSAASVTSHEYFHLWNVKRIRPFELGPFDYTGKVPSKALWQCEGVTSYYGDRALVRSGIWTEEKYFDHMASQIEILQNNPDRKVTSVEKASQVVWDRHDWPQVDYYNKGELLGWLMDLKIRTQSKGEKSYDDVMRFLYKTYCSTPPIGVGYPEDGILKALNTVTGSDWSDFYRRYISGVEELPYDLLRESGLSVDLRTVMTSDLGLGIRGTTVAYVPPEIKGVEKGDRITALNGVEIQRGNFRSEMDKLKPGESVKVRLGRGEKTEEVTLKVVEKERVKCKVRRAENPTDVQKRVIDGWLGK
jgi:predicted metalloprotease with PDZ domain